MRILISGNNDTAKAVRAQLAATFALVESSQDNPDYAVEIEHGAGRRIIFDSIDCPLEAHIYGHIRQLTAVPIETHTEGGKQSPRELKIIVPNSREVQDAVAKGVLRGFLDLFNKGDGRVSLQPAVVTGDQSGGVTIADIQQVLVSNFNQMTAILTAAADRSTMVQVKNELEAISNRMSEQLRVSVEAMKHDVHKFMDGEKAATNGLIASERQTIQAALEQMDKHSAAMDARFGELAESVLETLREEFAPVPVENPGFWRRIWAAITGRVQVFE